MFWQIPYFDDTHAPQGQVPAYAIGRNDVDLKSEIDIQNNLFLSSLPANWTIEPFYPNEAMTMYFVLDKDSLMVTIKAFASVFVSDVVANQPPAFPILVNPKTSPRYTGWKDPAGVTRKPPPSDKKGDEGDFSGASGLFAAAQALLAYSVALRSARRRHREICLRSHFRPYLDSNAGV